MATRLSLARPGGRFVLLSLRQQSTAVAAAPAASDADAEWARAKPFSELPGPKPISFLGKYGNIWRLLPFGPYGGMGMNEWSEKLIKEYGSVVGMKALGRMDLVVISDPKDIEMLYRNEGPWPIRKGIDSIDYYRRNMRKDVFNGNPGLASSQGQEWQVNRSAVNQHMMRPRNMLQYSTPIESATDDFINRMRRIRNDKLEMPADFDNELAKWALESVGLVALDTRLGCLEDNLRPDSDAQIMIDAVSTMFIQLANLDMKPSLYKFYSTRNWRKFVKALDTMTDISVKYINKKKAEIAARKPGEEPGNSILENLLNSPEGSKMAVIMVLDSLGAGIDTTSHTLANCLYYLAKNPATQDKLLAELKALMPKIGDPLPADTDNRTPYLKAVIKEAQRLSSITGGNSRETVKDMVIKGYQIPKGTQILINNQYLSLLEEHFQRAQEFIPERWLEGKESPISAKQTNPFVYMPFGFGPRMCVGRRIAELELRTGLSKMVRNFEVGFDYEMKWKQVLLISPDVPLRFRMKDRAD